MLKRTILVAVFCILSSGSAASAKRKFCMIDLPVRSEIESVDLPVQVENMTLTINAANECPSCPSCPECPAQKKNINTATHDELTAVSGVGDSKAESIILDIESNGFIDSCATLSFIDGISNSTALHLCDAFDVSVP